MKNQARPKSILVALCVSAGAFLTSIVLLPVIYLSLEHPGRETAAEHGAIEVTAESFSAAIGEVDHGAGSVSLVKLQGDRGLMVAPTAIDASEHPILSYKVLGGDSGLDGYFIWRTLQNPQQIQYTSIKLTNSNTVYVDLAEIENWTGTIQEVGFDVYGNLGNQALTVSGVQAIGLSSTNIWRLLLSDWLSFKPWNQTSINSLLWLYDLPFTSPVVLGAIWALLSLIFLVSLRVIGMRAPAASYLAILLIPWVALDLVWQLQLSRQADETYTTYSGLSYRDKHLAGPESTLYQYAEHLKQNVLSSPEATVFIVHESERHNYARLRLQYFLLPANIYNFGRALPEARHIRSGDYILVLGKVDDVVYSEADRKLRQGEREIDVVKADAHKLGKLYRKP